MRWLGKLLSPASGDSSAGLFNQATQHYRELRYIVGQPEQMRLRLATIASLCIRSLDKRWSNGDAYVLLANALSIAARYAPDSSARKSLQERAAGLVWYWSHSPIWTWNNSDIGRELLRMSRDELRRERELTPEQADKLMAELASALARETIKLANEPIIRAEITGSTVTDSGPVPDSSTARQRHRARPPAVGWICPACDRLNSPTRPVCKTCRSERPES